jgi:Protein of unknown function (DUF1353)
VPFVSGPVLTYVGGGWYRTVGPTEYVGGHRVDGGYEVFHIPSDLETDLASVPRLFWSLLPPTGVYERAAVLHDWGCRQLARGDCDLPSPDVDGLFRRVIREEQQTRQARMAPGWRRIHRFTDFTVRWNLWWGVRIGALRSAARRPGWWNWPDVPQFAAITAANLAVAFGAWWGSAALFDLLFT